MADKNTANIGFEKQIWNAACVLRGNMDASEYKNVVLGLIFLKYISDRFDDKYQELVEEGDGFEEDIDEYTSEGIFFVPADARWSEIAAKAHTPEIGTVIDNAMRAIEKENKRLKDILPKNFALEQAVRGKQWPGWKVVEGRSNRKYTDEGAVAQVVKNAGYNPYDEKIMGITNMTKMLGKEKFNELLVTLLKDHKVSQH